MKKIFAMILALLMLCSILCACGSGEKDTKKNGSSVATIANASEEYGVLGKYLSLDNYTVDTTSYSCIYWSGNNNVTHSDTIPTSITVEGIDLYLGMSYQEIVDGGIRYDSSANAIILYKGTIYYVTAPMQLPSGKKIDFGFVYDIGEEVEDSEEIVNAVLENGIIYSIELSPFESYDFECNEFSSSTSLAEFFDVFGYPNTAEEKEDYIDLWYSLGFEQVSAYFAPDGSKMTAVKIVGAKD